MSDPTIAERHKVTDPNHEDIAFSELSYYLHSKIDETEEITPVEIMKWMAEHKECCASRKCELGYKVI